VEGKIMKMPENIIPMRASAGKEPFSDLHYAFEIALNGVRAIAYIQDGIVKLKDQHLKDITGKYPQIVAALQKIQGSAIIDGEIVTLNDIGVSVEPDDDSPLYYFAYDLLYYRVKDYMPKPLYTRKSALKGMLPRSQVVVYHSEIVGHGNALYRHAEGLGMAGIIGKRIDSIYVPGSRSKDWIYVPVKVPAKAKH
jgi:bifunctional non-homologous end joining protein LigD